MIWLILALLVSVLLAAVVVGLVAVPARREGRQVLTERGETLVTSVAERKDKVTKAARSSVQRKNDADDDAVDDGGAEKSAG